jgi:hypothetical protein
MTSNAHAHVFSTDLSERMRRDAEDREVGAMLRRACARTGTKHTEAADAMGFGERGANTIAEIAVGKRPLHVRSAMKLPDSAFRAFFADVLGSRGYGIVALPGAEEVSADLAVDWTVKNATAFRAFFEAVQDKRIDRSESAAIIDTGMSLVGLVLGAVEVARTAEREGVVGIPAKRLSSTTTKAAR